MDRLDARLGRMTPAWVAVLLVVLTLCSTLPAFFTLPPVDRDEARFAQSSRQMVESGDWVDIRFQDGTRYKKPAGIYWLQAAAVRAVGGDDQAIWKYRLPSLLAAVGSVLLTAGMARGFGASGLIAGLMMAGCLILGAEARLAKTDAVLLFTILAAQGMLARAWRGESLSLGAAAVFWGALAASVLVKGPIGVMVTGLSVLALIGVTRRAGWLGHLRPLPGFVFFLALVVPWFVAITLKSGSAFWDEALGRDLLGKVAEAQESHGAPPGSYLAALWLTFFPGAMALAVSLPAIWRKRAAPAITFALCWAIPGWLVFEAAPTKLLHYTLPFYPALALMVAVVWPGVMTAGMAVWQRAVGWFLVTLPALLLLALSGVGWSMLTTPPGVAFLGPAILGPVLVLGAGAVAQVAMVRGLGHVALLSGAIAGAGFLGAGFAIVRAVPAIWHSPVIAEAARGNAACPAPQILTTGYFEPSLIFLAPGPVKRATVAEAAAAMAADACTLALIGFNEVDAFGAAARAAEITPQDVAHTRGINVGTGKGVWLTLWRR